MKRITDYEIVYHGVCYSDYFQGCGTAFTEFTDVATGIGNSEREALDDALEQLAQGDWDTGSNRQLDQDYVGADDTDLVQEVIEEMTDGANDYLPDDYEYPYVHVSVRVR